jgi:hypothetical protein
VVRHFDFHARLRQGPHSFPEEIHVLTQLGLAQQLVKCHAHLIGHAAILLRACLLISPDEHHLMADLVNRSLFPTRYWTLSWQLFPPFEPSDRSAFETE